MSTRRYKVGQATAPDKLNQKFSFTGKVRGADVLLRLVEACGYEIVREALEELRPTVAVVTIPDTEKPTQSKRRKAKSSASSKSY